MYRKNISVNPNIVVQGLQSDILANIHDRHTTSVENQMLTTAYTTISLLLFDNFSIPVSTNEASNNIRTTILHPDTEYSFYGEVSDYSIMVRLDISFDGIRFYDSNEPVTLNTSNEFSVNYKTQAPYLRLRGFNQSGSTIYTIVKAYCSYKYIRVKLTNDIILDLQENLSFVTKD